MSLYLSIASTDRVASKRKRYFSRTLLPENDSPNTSQATKIEKHEPKKKKTPRHFFTTAVGQLGFLVIYVPQVFLSSRSPPHSSRESITDQINVSRSRSRVLLVSHLRNNIVRPACKILQITSATNHSRSKTAKRTITSRKHKKRVLKSYFPAECFP